MCVLQMDTNSDDITSSRSMNAFTINKNIKFLDIFFRENKAGEMKKRSL